MSLIFWSMDLKAWFSDQWISGRPAIRRLRFLMCFCYCSHLKHLLCGGITFPVFLLISMVANTWIHSSISTRYITFLPSKRCKKKWMNKWKQTIEQNWTVLLPCSAQMSGIKSRLQIHGWRENRYYEGRPWLKHTSVGISWLLQGSEAEKRASMVSIGLCTDARLVRTKITTPIIPQNESCKSLVSEKLHRLQLYAAAPGSLITPKKSSLMVPMQNCKA